QALDKFRRAGGQSALALHRLDKETGGFVVDQRQRALQIVEGGVIEARQQRLEAVAHLGLVGRADRAERAAVKRVAEGDELVTLWIAIGEMIAPRRLDRTFD